MWSLFSDCEDKPFEKQLKLVLKVGGSEITELSGSGHDSSYYDDRSDHERERHKDKKKKKKKKSEKEKDKHVDDEERRRRKVSMRGTRVCPKWHPIPYIVHYFWPDPYGPWSEGGHTIKGIWCNLGVNLSYKAYHIT
jgi:hypothetical protein